MYGRQMRSAVRLPADPSGTVTLRRHHAPSITCTLQNISETGCRCVARVRSDDPTDAQRMRTRLITGELYEAEIVFDPHIPYLRIPVEIRHTGNPTAVSFDLGLQFYDLEDDHRQTLKQALVSIASEKIRQTVVAMKQNKVNRAVAAATIAAAPATKASAPPALGTRLSAFSRPHKKTTVTIPPISAERESPAVKNDLKLGEILSNSGLLTRGEVANAVFAAREKAQKLGEYLVNQGRLTPTQVMQARALQTGMAYIELDKNAISMALLELFPFAKMKSLHFVPFEILGDSVKIACANPVPRMELDVLSYMCGKRIEAFLCREDLPGDVFEIVAREFEHYQRSTPRVKVSLAASFQCRIPKGPLLTEATFRGRTVDISDGGMQVVGPVILGIDPNGLSRGRVKMTVTVKAEHQDIVAVCEPVHVRYLRNSSGGNTCVYGLKVETMSPPHREIFQALLRGITTQVPNVTPASKRALALQDCDDEF